MLIRDVRGCMRGGCYTIHGLEDSQTVNQSPLMRTRVRETPVIVRGGGGVGGGGDIYVMSTGGVIIQSVVTFDAYEGEGDSRHLQGCHVGAHKCPHRTKT